MKKFISVILVLCTLLTLLIPAAGAADSTDTMTDLQRAVVETALTYYYKGNAVHYDSYYLGKGSRYHSGILRQTNNREPEEASIDDLHYTVCSAFPHDSYYSAFGMHIVDSARQKAIEDITQKFTSYYDGMNLTEEELNYEYGIQGVTAGYVAMGRLWKETGVNLDNMVIGYWGPSEYDENGNATALDTGTTDYAKVQAMLQPGDIIAARPLSTTAMDDDATSDGDSSDESTGTSTTAYTYTGGHTMMFLGDIFGDDKDYVIHSGGNKYNNDDTTKTAYYDSEGNRIYGFDLQEAPYSWGHSNSNYSRNGSIAVAPYDYLLGEGDSYDVQNCYDLAILRPVNAVTEADLTDAAKFRLDRPALGITKTADVKPYRDVKVGDTITYTIDIENNTIDTENKNNLGIKKGVLGFIGIGNEYYGAVVEGSRNQTYTDLKLAETIPAGTEFVSATGSYTKSGSTLTWNVGSLAPEATNTMTYTVKVTGGSQVVSPKGTITATGADGCLQTKELTHEVVGAQMNATAVAGITASSVTASTEALRSGTDVAEDVYAALGYELELPDGQQIVDALFREVPLVKDSASRNQVDHQLVDASELDTDEAKTLRNMIVPGFIGGQRLFTADENGVRTNENRLRVLNEEFVQPGDVLVYMNGSRSSSGATFARATGIISEDAYVYLGGSDWAHYVDGVFTVTNDPVKIYYSTSSATKAAGTMESDAGSNTSGAKSGSRKYAHNNILYQAFLQDLFVLMRPSRVGLTSTAASANTKAVELQSGSTSTFYAGLKAAYTDAVDGDTIVLHEDVSLSSTLTIGKNVTVDLNGHTITSTATTQKDTLNLWSSSKISIVLKNGTVDGVVYAGSTTSVRLENMTLLGRDWEYLSGSITRQGAAFVASNSAWITMKNVSVASPSAAYGPIQIKDSTGAYDFDRVTIEDDVKILVPTGAAWDYSSLNLASGVEAYPGTGTRSLDGMVQSEYADVAYTAVTFTSKPDVYNETKKTYYASLSEAVLKAASEDTLHLMRDVDVSDFDEAPQSYDTAANGYAVKYMYSIKKDLTLEMDGFTVYDDVMPSGTFIFRDDGKTNNGLSTVTVRNGKIYSKMTTFNCGQAVLEGVEAYAGQYGVFLSSSGKAGQTLLVKDSRLFGGMKGGHSGNALYAAYGEVTVQNSVLGSNSNETIFAGFTSDDKYYTGTVTLEDVTLAAQMYTYNANGTSTNKGDATSSVTVADGYAKTATRQAEAVAMDGKELKFLADVYTVVDVAATVNGKEYASVERALADLQEGEAAELEADTTVSANATVPAGATLSVGDHALTVAEGAALTVAGKVTAGEAGSITADASQIVLEGEGDYLGITIPEGVEADVVHPDVELTSDKLDLGLSLGSKLALMCQITEDTAAAYDSLAAWDADAGKILTENITSGSDISLKTVAAKEMSDETTMLLLAEKDGETYVGRTMTVSVREQAEARLASLDWDTEAAQGRALIALLNYGAEAQNFFGHNADDPANAGVDSYKSYMDEKFTSAFVGQYRKDASILMGKQADVVYGTSCVLGENMQLRFYFRVDAGQGQDLTFLVGGQTLTIADMEKAQSNSTTSDYYSYTVSDLTAADIFEEVTVTVKQGSKTVAVAKDSIGSYVARMYAKDSKYQALSDTMLIYGLAAQDNA